MHAELATHGWHVGRGRGEKADDARGGKKFWHFLEMSLIMSTTTFCQFAYTQGQGFQNCGLPHSRKIYLGNRCDRKVNHLEIFTKTF